MLLEVARSQRRDDSLDSDGVPAVRLEWTTTGLGFARSVTQPKILRTKARPPSPTIVLARAEFTDNSARKLSLSGRDDNSPPLDEGFSSPPPTSVDAAFVLGTLAEHLTKMTHRRAKRAPRRLTSASPPPPPPPSPVRRQTQESRMRTATNSPATPARRRLEMERVLVLDDTDKENATHALSRFERQSRGGVVVQTPDSAALADGGLPSGLPTSTRNSRARLEGSGFLVPLAVSAPAPTKAKNTKTKPPKALGGVGFYGQTVSVSVAKKTTPAPRTPRTPPKRKRAALLATAKAVHFVDDVEEDTDDEDDEDDDEDDEKDNKKSPRKNGYSELELSQLKSENPVAWKRLMGNRRSAANSKARRDLALASVREENAVLREENAQLKKRLAESTPATKAAAAKKTKSKTKPRVDPSRAAKRMSKMRREE
jgi:hypothetical protein